MNTFFESIAYNLSRLADPSGRESNIRFWPYAILVAGLNYLAGSFVAAPMMTAMMQQMAEVIGDVGKGTRPPPEAFEFMPDMSALVVPHSIILLVTVALLFSAVSRRLHDRDRSGFWGLMPLPFAILAIAMMPYVFDGLDAGRPDPGLFTALMLNSFVYMGLLLFLIVLLVGKGTDGPNRFGPPAQ